MQVKVKVTTVPAVLPVQAFADLVKRKRPQIDRAVSDGLLDHGFVLGVKVIIINKKAEGYTDLCDALDEVTKQKRKK